ncbi:MAG: aldo/keto reductase [Dehalococcoidales bacterium]|nr:aldo/keto reductase [Dehalococcoidales bacterium]
MQYRKFGKLDWQVSALGLGLENLPEAEDEAIKIIRAAIDGGVNFIDAGSAGQLKRNAPLLAKALADGNREKVKIAAVIPAGGINTAADFERELENLLNLFNNEHPDFITLGGLNRFTWEKAAGLKITKLIEKAFVDRKIKYAGFAFHDEYQFLRDIIAAYDAWTFCQFQFSFMDIDHHPGVTGLSYAAEKGLGVIATKPLKGGSLTSNIPENVAKIWEEAKPKRSPAEWGLRWVWNHGEVATAICDMSSLEQVKENIRIAVEAETGAFSVMDELAISKARDAYRSLKPIPCTACRGCMPCPQDIDAPRIFEIYNDAVMYNDTATAREIYRREKHHIENCNECKMCENRCGKRILLAEWLKKARELLT